MKNIRSIKACVFIFIISVTLIKWTLVFALNPGSSNVPVKQIISGKVVGIADGDTLTLLNQEKQQLHVRLVGIDCPEKSQAFGNRAKKELSAKVFGQNVEVEVRGQDKYGRTLGVVHLGPVDVNEYLISQGVAWHYKKYANQQPSEEATRYALAEEHAKKFKLGLWVQENPTPPWEYRKSNPRQSTDQSKE